jgi:hypothetical protein
MLLISSLFSELVSGAFLADPALIMGVMASLLVLKEGSAPVAQAQSRQAYCCGK